VKLNKENDKLVVKLVSFQEAYENLLCKMETLSKHNDELTNKFDAIDSVGHLFSNVVDKNKATQLLIITDLRLPKHYFHM
jgi:hypothetical protein